MTITEALAEIKTVLKRITSKREFINQYLVRAEHVRDPHEKDGGSAEVIKRELQAIADLEARVVELRRQINRANEKTEVTLEGVTRTISDWIIWRREVSMGQKNFLVRMRNEIKNARDNVRRQNITSMTTAGNQEVKPLEMFVHVNEQKLSQDIERLENILGQLDGQLSLKNATVQID